MKSWRVVSGRRFISIYFFFVLVVGGCASPGETIDLIQSTPTSVALKYTHSYSFEFAEVLKMAELYCNKYKKHAELVSNTQINLDRSIATFRCVKG